ncbi:hypothetical protein CA13_41370 [Planctomycetes bacterium CA13]|uniref:DUF4112 domain-containing protein n=1 Tax=Novipirellula herctigrandis TaxID=2527986 RepID=A0A5C5Z5Z8_9BACT|nr:hypothetical protein CA13_41370 [Planctomycetes bacterium CA13]
MKEDLPVLTPDQRDSSPELKWVDSFSRLLDTHFRIPGTRVRFGADFIMGLIPGLGDVVSMGLSGLLIATMAKKGASGRLVVRMLLNVLVDTIVGAVPVLGNVFDLFYKANYRNLELMREYYDEGEHTGSVWPVIGLVLVVIVVLLAVIAWLLRSIYRSIFGG